MKKLLSIALALALSTSIVGTAMAQAPADAEAPQETAAEGQSEGGEQAGEPAGEGQSEGGEQAGEPAGEGQSEGGEQGGESGGDGMDGNQASSDVAPEGSINISTGETDLDGEEIVVWEGSAIQNSGDSVIVARNCYIEGDTTEVTGPLEGNPGNLLVAGNIRTTLALGQGQSFYINSTIVSRNWAALSTDGAEPVTEDGQKELSLYAYGSTAVTEDGGYGAYSDLFCNLYLYGSKIDSAEIGIISGTYGKVFAGTIADGDADEDMASHLTDDDKAAWEDKTAGSTVTGGRNAIMIHSVNLPPYWEYDGYSQEELPLYSTPVVINGSVFATDLSLDQGVEYEAQKQAYINHTAGSVILVKSTNAEITLTDSALEADEAGNGYAIQTVYNNDTMFMNAVPDGEEYPGINVYAENSEINGSVAHEDYQRDMYLVLSGSVITGSMNEYDCAHWNEVSAAEGFTDYCLDASYETHHGLYVTLEEGSVWNVTGESVLSGLTVEEGSEVNGIITVDGEAVDVVGTYEGVIVVTPAEETAAAADAADAEGSDQETSKWDAWISYLVDCLNTDPSFELYDQILGELQEAKEEDYHGMEDGTVYGVFAFWYGATPYEDYEIGEAVPEALTEHEDPAAEAPDDKSFE